MKDIEIGVGPSSIGKRSVRARVPTSNNGVADDGVSPSIHHHKRTKQQHYQQRHRNSTWRYYYTVFAGSSNRSDITTTIIYTLLCCVTSIMLVVFGIIIGYNISHTLDNQPQRPAHSWSSNLLHFQQQQSITSDRTDRQSRNNNRLKILQDKLAQQQEQPPKKQQQQQKDVVNVNLLSINDYVPHKPVYAVEIVKAIEPIVQDKNEQKNQEELIDMRILNYEMKYQNIDGGVWKQGFDIHVDPIQMKKQQQQQQQQVNNVRRNDELQEQQNNDDNNMLQIFVVPHSHCDPGWIQTFDSYFREQTSNIITTVITSLLQDVRRTFIWAEISYFSWWYEIQNTTMKQHVRTLLDNGQLEFVTGGWVQPDEANSVLYAMEIQLQEGHDWITKNIGKKYIPQYGWAIDPFGYSPTAAYLWKKYNFSGILIQRVHYEIKKELATRKHLEFFWRQTWDINTTTAIHDPINNQVVQPHDLFTHVMPFYSYDVPHTCGPDPSICCQFDFARSPKVYLKNGQNQQHSITCPWPPQSQEITQENVRERAELLLDQYRKKAMLYRSNAVLIPVGDDFRYQSINEAESQYNNYQLLFDYINANVANVHVQFSTLSEYFRAARRTFHGPIPILKGSFFTYSDRENDYWSGYFTSRAFDKALDRQLERTLYTAESLGGTRTDLQAPRRALSLFQHHDGVTGTAKPLVVEDYARRMYDAINKTYNWILQTNRDKISSLLTKLSIDEIQPCLTSSAPRDIQHNLCINNDVSLQQQLDDKIDIVVYNPLAQYTQYCGNIAIPGKTWAHVTMPCDIPGPFEELMTSRPIFDNITGLMLSPIKEEWKVWNVNEGGAYLFFPHHMTNYDLVNNDLIVENGGYFVRTKYWNRTVVERKVVIKDESKSDTIKLCIDFIYETNLLANNREWLARFSSSTTIHSDGYFYTDLNGFNFDTHRFRSDMPIQSQVFPMPTLASIQDNDLRLTVLSEHSQGSSSIENGSIDVWLDRRLQQDDNRGLGDGVLDNRPTRTRFRVVLESQNQQFRSSNKYDYNISTFVRQMWDELQHPLVMFGKHLIIPETKRNLEQVDNISTGDDVPFVIMSYKRSDYLKSVIRSIKESDFPRGRVPLIISHDGNITEMTEYVQSLKVDFPKLIQIYHPYSCHDHPNSFPGNDTSLNLNYTGDTFGHPRSWQSTCCKHHFTWLMSAVFTQLSELKSYETFLFSEEDYVVGPTIYQAIKNGLISLKANADQFEGGLFGLALDPTIRGSAIPPLALMNADVWYNSVFISGPMTMNRNIFKKIQEHASTYCGVDGFDEYNWDWSFVHMQSIRQIPYSVLIPTPRRPLVRHIGLKDGIHDHKKEIQNISEVINTTFTGATTHLQYRPPPRIREKGFGGWGHPQDQQHCMKVIMETNEMKVGNKEIDRAFN